MTFRRLHHLAIIGFCVAACGHLFTSRGDGAVPATINAKIVVATTLSSGHRLQRMMVPMPDKTQLATDVVFPKGDGPWPVLLFRTPYGRTSSIENAISLVDQGIVYVTQDFRGLHGSEGEFERFAHEIEDGYDCVNWVADQQWCDGRIAMRGGSGPGIGAKMAMIKNPPNLTAVTTSVAASNVYHYCFYHGGVYRAHMCDTWFRGQDQPVDEWPKPRTLPLTDNEQTRMLSRLGATIETATYDIGGWFDIFSQSTLDDFTALKSNPNRRMVIGGTGHGRLDGLPFPNTARGNTRANDWLIHWLKGDRPDVLRTPPVLYYLMGDVRDPAAPGNRWKQADTWPVKHTPTAFYFHENGGLSGDVPATPQSLTYQYDPNNPVPTIGGNNLSLPKGPMDQRPLKDRDDILRFTSPPLDEPLEITGNVKVDLTISTDVADTTFMAKLIDVYPDGYEALILDSAVMARYWKGLDQPAPLEKGKTYSLTIDLWSTALVVNRGHRLAVHVTSSNAPRYEAHPNLYEPTFSYLLSPVANNTVHCGGVNPSRITLPVILPGESKDYP